MKRTAAPTSVAALIFTLCTVPLARAQLVADAYEEAPAVRLDELLPASVQQSGTHRVTDDVMVRGNLLEFTIESSQGEYRVLSLPMLLIRVQEVLTLAQAVDEYQRSNQQLAAELRGVMQVGDDSAVGMLASPIKTTSSIVSQFFNQNIGQTIDELGNLSDPNVRRVRDPDAPLKEGVYESLEPEDPVLASHKRSVAAHLNLDVYSSNPRVQVFLDTVAYARTSGNRNAGMVMVSLPRGVEVRVADGRIENEVRNAVTRSTIRELYKHNTMLLQTAGVKEELLHAFLTHGAYSPRHKTAISALVAHLDKVENRGALLESALGAKGEEDALAYLNMTRMLARYHESVAELASLVSGGNVVMATTREGGMAIALPFDLLYWSEETDRVFSGLAAFADSKQYQRRDLVLGGVVSSRASHQLEQRGFRVLERFLFSK